MEIKTRDDLKKDGYVAVLITTDENNRGVFFGYIKPEDAKNDNIDVYFTQMAIYWCRNTRGVLGLAVDGPKSGSRVSRPGEELNKSHIKFVSFVMEVSEKAEELWLKGPWEKMYEDES